MDFQAQGSVHGVHPRPARLAQAHHVRHIDRVGRTEVHGQEEMLDLLVEGGGQRPARAPADAAGRQADITGADPAPGPGLLPWKSRLPGPLPALAPLCALFGIGTNAALGWNKIVRWRLTGSLVTASVVLICAVPPLIYLFKQDRLILEAARWTRAHTGSNDSILFRPDHRWDMIDYPFNAVLAYYSDRHTFVWTRYTPDQYRQAALQRASYAIVTLPQPPAGGILGAVNRFRHAYDRQPESVDWLDSAGFEKVATGEGFAAYRKKIVDPN